MGAKLQSFLLMLGVTWRALAAIFAAFAIGMTAALMFAGWVNLPKEVQKQQDAIVDLRISQARTAARVDSLVGDMARVRCVVEAQALNESPIRQCGLMR